MRSSSKWVLTHMKLSKENHPHFSFYHHVKKCSFDFRIPHIHFWGTRSSSEWVLTWKNFENDISHTFYFDNAVKECILPSKHHKFIFGGDQEFFGMSSYMSQNFQNATQSILAQCVPVISVCQIDKRMPQKKKKQGIRHPRARRRGGVPAGVNHRALDKD